MGKARGEGRTDTFLFPPATSPFKLLLQHHLIQDKFGFADEKQWQTDCAAPPKAGEGNMQIGDYMCLLWAIFPAPRHPKSHFF